MDSIDRKIRILKKSLKRTKSFMDTDGSTKGEELYVESIIDDMITKALSLEYEIIPDFG